MVQATLLLSSLVGSVASGMFLSTGLTLRHRQHHVSNEARSAMMLFSAWWICLAIYANMAASQDLLAALGIHSVGLFLFLRYLGLIALSIGLWGLMYYVAYVLTGSRRYLVPMAAFYAFYYAIVVFVVTVGQPDSVVVNAWSSHLGQQAPVFDDMAITLLLVFPPLVAALTYALLYFHVDEPLLRRRVLLVSAATLAWAVSEVAREAPWTAMLPALLALGSAWCVAWSFRSERPPSARARAEA